MKRLFFVLTILFASQISFAQNSSALEVNIQGGPTRLKDGKAKITNVYYKFDKSDNTKCTYVVRFQQEKSYDIKCKDFPYDDFITPATKSVQDLWDVLTINSLKDLSKMTELYEIREGLEEDAINYISKLQSYGLILDDPILESYIYSIATKIAPSRRLDGFPYNLSIYIRKDDSLNACSFPNGIIIINTGLLAALHTEDELVAVLSHEIAHFASNHQLVNIKKAIDRENRQKAFAAFAGALGAAAGGIMAAKGGYVQGAITMAAAASVFAAAMSSEINKQLGLEYQKSQEVLADNMSTVVLKNQGYDTNALATVFSRIAKYNFDEGNWASYYMTGDHPSLEERIKQCGTPFSKVDKEFEKKVSTAVTSAAISKFHLGRFRQALQYVNQNIDNGIGTDDDYLIKARCLLNLASSQDSNLEALSLVKKAKEINPDNVNILKCEILSTIRNEQKQETIRLISEYQNKINNTLEIVDRDSVEYGYWYNELDWTRKMIVKVNAM